MGGFSQGAFMASIVWKKYQKPLGGLILFSSATNKSSRVDEAQENSPVFWSHGLDDCLFLYRHGEYNNLMLDDGKRKFLHVSRDGLGHAVDVVVKMRAKSFMEDIMTRPKL